MRSYSCPACRQAALHQRIAFVRAAVVAGEDTAVAGEDRDLLAAGLEEVAALGQQDLQRRDADQRCGGFVIAFPGQGHDQSPASYFRKDYLSKQPMPETCLSQEKSLVIIHEHP